MFEKELEVVKIQNNIFIIQEHLIKQICKCRRRFSSLYQTVADICNKELESTSISKWVVESQTMYIQKDPSKGNAAGNYRPIAYLNLY